jgi:hypothetical protein
MQNPVANLRTIRARVVADVQELGIREAARIADINRMRVQRFCANQGADDAATLFILAGIFGYHITLKPGPIFANQVELALSKSRIKRGRTAAESE